NDTIVISLTPLLRGAILGALTTEYASGPEVARRTEVRAAMGEAGESPALSRNCIQGRTLRARIPASAVLQTPSRERGQERWRGLAGRGGFFTGRSRPPPSRGPDPGSIFQTLVAETRAFYFPEDQEENNE